MRGASARDQQLAELVERGYEAQEVAHYCDGTSSVDALVDLINEDAAELENDAAPLLAAGAAKGAEGGGRGGGSSFCSVQ